MKYVISTMGEVKIGNGLHSDIAKDFQGRVVRAGQCEMLEDGWTVYGQSYGYGIKARNSDREFLEDLKYTQ